jgi:hypothetical protein
MWLQINAKNSLINVHSNEHEISQINKKKKEKVKCVCSWLSIQRCDATNFQESENCIVVKKMKSCEKNGPMVKFWAL